MRDGKKGQCTASQTCFAERVLRIYNSLFWIGKKDLYETNLPKQKRKTRHRLSRDRFMTVNRMVNRSIADCYRMWQS